MATTIQQYVAAIMQREQIVAAKAGVDLSATGKEMRVLNRCMVVLVSVLCKAIVDKGVVTDAEMLALLDAAGSVAWADMPLNPDGTL